LLETIQGKYCPILIKTDLLFANGTMRARLNPKKILGIELLDIEGVFTSEVRHVKNL